MAYIWGLMPKSEKTLIADLRRMAFCLEATRHADSRGLVSRGIGDDCAVLRPRAGHEILVTTDFSLEGIHFRREWHSPESAGHRCLARGLSDIAAMGGEPLAAFLSLALPRDLPHAWVRRFARGLLNLAGKHGVTLAGGDTSESASGILADIVVVGSVPRGKAVLRSTARPGDGIYVTGRLGGSAAALQRMLAGENIGTAGYRRHFLPDPRIEVGKLLGQKKLASAMIDISDGLSTDLAHICQESGVGAEIQEDAVPRARVGKPLRDVSLELALHGGEDYELLFAAPKGQRVPERLAGIAITKIGVVTQGSKILLRHGDGLGRLEAQGWEHFRCKA